MSGRLDLNQRPPAPQAGALDRCATPRLYYINIELVISQYRDI